MRNDVKEVMLSIMENHIDGALFAHGFQRRKNAFTYSRRMGTVKQKIEMIFFSHPSYHPGALAHIYPWLFVCIPEIDEIVNEMVEGTVLSGMQKETVRQPIQVYADSERWMLLDDKENAELAKRMEALLNSYTIPLLDFLNGMDGYIHMYEVRDKRLIWDDMQYISIAGAYVLKGDYLNAKNVMEERFGKTGMRRQFETVFAYLEQRDTMK